ncbi:hypothetical protein GCM10009422_09050 [Brevundimonas kwangchunensis]|uniref:Uncharacterized protein n=1 Tax=Brevundimonas kwangchunensis TaxID=322163 RepID=A0ABP3RT83_9CAUL
MFRIGMIAAVAMLTAGFQSIPAGAQLPPELIPLTEDVGAASSFDYMALKASGADLTALSGAVFRRTMAEGGPRRCLTEAEAVFQENLAAAAEAADQVAFDDDRAAASEAWGKWLLFVEGMQNGQVATEEPFKWASDRYARAAAETNPRARELEYRTAGDQLHRYAFTGGAQVWGEVSPAANARLMNRLGRSTCITDKDNTEWLKADVAANGWFTRSATGERASSSAWLMAQHADNDRDFQRHVLALMEPLVEQGEVSPNNYGYLFDRIAVAENRPQRYGTQGECKSPGRWEPNALEDPERVDALRAEAEIYGTLAEYQARMHAHCPG